MEEIHEKWDTEIQPRSGLFDLNLKDIWHYRDLLLLLVKRDYVSSFKQTILGPIWFFIQPILTTLVYMVLFNRIAGLSTDGIPPLAFYLSGVIMWNYFAACLNATASTFVANANIFGKVYFPRLIMPLSVVMSNLLKFAVQFSFFIIVIAYYKLTGNQDIQLSWHILLSPVLVLLMAILGLSMGLIISSMTTKYRDLVHLVAFGVQLMMFITPVVYTASAIQGKLKTLILLNPMTGIIEGFRYAFLGTGSFDFGMLGYSAIVSFALLAIAIVIFNRVEKGFMDTV
ncbi:MAG: ABC transporter permease [Flavobacteriales bacterium]|jgi:lipopolysaccharide transport system permease protein